MYVQIRVAIGASVDDSSNDKKIPILNIIFLAIGGAIQLDNAMRLSDDSDKSLLWQNL